MKSFSWMFMMATILAACGPSQANVDIAQAQSMIEAMQAAQEASRSAQIAAQGISDVARGVTIILVLLALIFVMMLGLGVVFAIQRLVRQHSAVRQIPSGSWASGPNALWKKTEEEHLTRQLLIDQHWLLSQLLQGQEDADPTDLPDLPVDWWH